MSKQEQQLQRRLVELESEHDYLQQEIQYLDVLMRMIGFSGGLATVKAAANAIIENGYQIDPEAVSNFDIEKYEDDRQYNWEEEI